MIFKVFLLLLSVSLAISTESDCETEKEELQLISVQTGSSGSGSNVANYNEPCSKGKVCDFNNKGLLCQNGFCKCEEYAAIHEGKCFPVASSLNNYRCINDWACHNSQLGPNTKCQLQNGESKCVCFNHQSDSVLSSSVLLVNGKCLPQIKIGENCESNAHCSTFITGWSQCRLGKCSCLNGYVPNSKRDSCLTPAPVTPGSFCIADEQCSRSMGNLSQCKFNNCQCYDTVNGKESPKYARPTGFINERCFYSKKMKDNCSSDEECKLGAHPNATCSRPFIFHLKTCSCKKGKNCDFVL